MHQHSRGFAVEAPAKINLYLRIAGRREDGFHELDTLMQSISRRANVGNFGSIHIPYSLLI